MNENNNINVHCLIRIKYCSFYSPSWQGESKIVPMSIICSLTSPLTHFAVVGSDVFLVIEWGYRFLDSINCLQSLWTVKCQCNAKIETWYFLVFICTQVKHCVHLMRGERVLKYFLLNLFKGTLSVDETLELACLMHTITHRNRLLALPDIQSALILIVFFSLLMSILMLYIYHKRYWINL